MLCLVVLRLLCGLVGLFALRCGLWVVVVVVVVEVVWGWVLGCLGSMAGCRVCWGVLLWWL